MMRRAATAYLGKSPLLVLLLETRHDNRHHSKRIPEHFISYLAALLCAVDLLEDAFVDRRALPAKAGWHLECHPLSRTQGEHLLCNGFKELDTLLVGLNVEIVIVALLLDTVEAFLVSILPVRDKARVF